MKLTFEQIKKYTVGAVTVREENGVIRFFKCTDKQNAAWDALSETLGQRARTTTGVRIDFITTSQKLTFTAKGGKFEIYVDDLMRVQHVLSEMTEVSLDLRAPLGDQKESYRVTLCFPSHGIGVLESLELEDGSTLTSPEYDTKMLFIGVSFTQGWNSKYDTLSYAYRVSRFFNANSVIQGIGGAFYHESCFDHIDFDPDTVIVAYGTNDFNRYKTYEEFRGHVSAHLSLIAKEYASKRIFVLSPIWRKDLQLRSMGSFDGARQIVIDEAEKLGLIHLDGLKFVPPMAEFFADAHLHPDSEGFSLYAENLIRELIRYM